MVHSVYQMPQLDVLHLLDGDAEVIGGVQQCRDGAPVLLDDGEFGLLNVGEDGADLCQPDAVEVVGDGTEHRQLLRLLQ